jgi:hypothetical protein
MYMSSSFALPARGTIEQRRGGKYNHNHNNNNNNNNGSR